jgi:predicted RNA-binding protein YlxR (DUF448 family)
VRVVHRDGRLEVGRTLPGRGAWLCAGSPACVDLAEKRKAFDRAFRAPVEPDAIRSLRAVLADRERMARDDEDEATKTKR